MSFFVAIDSCGELTAEMKESGCFGSVPLTLDIDGYQIIDDDSFDQADFLARVAATQNPAHSACPSPDLYREAFDRDVDHIYAVTLSAELSGSYNSAMLGRDLALDEHPERQIHVFNSRSASIGETLIGLKIRECEEAGMSFEQVIRTVESYIESQVTWFVLLRKNGRLGNLTAAVATMLNIKPVMTSTPEGTIAQLTKCRGIKRAMVEMVNNIASTAKNTKDKILAISHCNCPDRAEMVKEALMERIPLKDVIVLDTGGVSSLYASDGGIIVVV